MKIQLYDTSLRDGEQCEGVSLSLEDKLRIARRLDDFGIDIIEGGYPASNPKDAAFFEAIAAEPLENARLAAFGMTCKKGTRAEDDPGLAALLATEAPVIALVGKTWDEHVENVLMCSLEENLRMISDSVAFLVAAGREVVFDAEHFFDGFAENEAYAMECIIAAASTGASTICLCDTRGASLPFEIERVVAEVVAKLDEAVPGTGVAIHAHNDTGCAVANSLAAVRGGAVQVQGTINGFGERVGNADLITVAANLQLKMGYECVSAEQLASATSLSHFVAEVVNLRLSSHYPYTGTSAFTHKGGLHASATARDERAYEHIPPEAVGNARRMVVSELAGKAALQAKVESLGFDMSDKETLQAVLDDIKAREAEGYSYELADGSLALLVRTHLGDYRPYFTLESFRVIVDDYEERSAAANGARSEATIKIHVGDERFVATGEGGGPVAALDMALRMALRPFYPQLADIELTDFKVRLLDESVGTDAVTRVTIVARDESGSWGSVGVSDNIIEASWNALVDSIEYGLTRARVIPPVR